MKRISGILILIIICFICGSPTCSEDSHMKSVNEQNALALSRDSIRKAFEIDYPDEELLKAYEETAKQKLSDFADYHKIVSDTSVNIKFREQGAEMVKNLFISNDIKIRNWGYGESENDISTLKELLEKGLSEGSAYWTQPEQIKVLSPLAAVNDSTYTGRLSFYKKCTPFDTRKSQPPISQMISVDIHVIKRGKSFGDTTIMMWEVYLGNLN
jgi:hypothetical protein